MVNRLPDKYTLSFLFKKNFLLKFKSHFSLQHHRQIFHCLCLVQTFIIPLRQLRHVALTAGIKTTNFKLGSDSNECVPFTNACRSPRPCNIVYSSSLTTCSLHFSHLERKSLHFGNLTWQECILSSMIVSFVSPFPDEKHLLHLKTFSLTENMGAHLVSRW